jgi:hypothetical protein
MIFRALSSSATTGQVVAVVVVVLWTHYSSDSSSGIPNYLRVQLEIRFYKERSQHSLHEFASHVRDSSDPDPR